MQYNTISIPYAEGDIDGGLTSEVVKLMSSSGALQYVSCGGDLSLRIRVLDLRDENIGFRYDRKKKGSLKKTIIPTETRMIANVEVTLIDTHQNQVIRGPTRIKASLDFDHDYYSSRNAINIFSLGQLSDIDAAQDAAIHPLNRILAEKIVDYVNNSW
jgi:hypothetical protein